TLNALFPAGAERGRTVGVTASGTFDHWPVRTWVDGAGVEVEAGAEKGALTFRVADDAEPGVRWVRLFDKEGATALRPFVVALLPDAVGRDPRVVFEAPADGMYLARVFAFPATPDSSIRFAGGDAFIYRLTLTTGGFLDQAFPLAVSRDDPGPVAAVGTN